MSDVIEFTPEILRFCQQPEMRNRLNELLGEPTMRHAIEALGSLGMPRQIPRHVPGVHHDTTVAHMYHRQLGVRTVLTMLHKMTMQPTTVELAEAEEEMFTSGLPKEFKEDPNKKR